LGLVDPRQTEGSGLDKTESAITEFTIGICATGVSSGVPRLMDVIDREAFPLGFSLSRIVVVASACADSTLAYLRQRKRADTRVVLIEEEERRGKAEAVNLVMAESVGEYLVFVNADALPERGAFSKLLRAIEHDWSAGVISGSPKVTSKGAVASGLVQLMWETHNECSADLEKTRLANHGTDELMVVRSGALVSLPPGLVNDGAYIAGVAKQRGYSVRSLVSARVTVEAPSRPIDVIRQRRRILYGHIQIWRLVGEAPRTAESLMLLSPDMGFRVVAKAISRHPRLLWALPLASMSELISLMGAICDTLGSGKKHAVWERFGD
jgi:cellulose synthase/poly-beta-1,6-N-acetylglucosamine synthase-like glycosyltransferase